jgi:hypothetical protein
VARRRSLHICSSVNHHWRFIWRMSRIEKIYTRPSSLRVCKLIIWFHLFFRLLCIYIIQILCLIRFLLPTWRSLPLIILHEIRVVGTEMIIINLLPSSNGIRGLIIVKKVSRPLSWVFHPNIINKLISIYIGFP